MSGRFDQVPLISNNDEKDFIPRNSLHDPGEDVHDVFIREHLWRQQRCCRVFGLGVAIVLLLFAAGSIAYYFLILQNTDTSSDTAVGLDKQSPTTGINKEDIIVEVTNNFLYDTEKPGIKGKESDMQDVIANSKDDSTVLDSWKDTDEDYFEEPYEQNSEGPIEVKNLGTEKIYKDDSTTEHVDVELNEGYSETVAVDFIGADALDVTSKNEESSDILTNSSQHEEDGTEPEDSDSDVSLNEWNKKQNPKVNETIQDEEADASSPVNEGNKDESTNVEGSYRTESREYVNKNEDIFELNDVDTSQDAINIGGGDGYEIVPKTDADDEDDLGEKSLWSRVFGEDYDEYNKDIDTYNYPVQDSVQYGSFSDEEKEDLFTKQK